MHRHSWFAPARCFSDFFRDVSHEMIGFGTIFGRGLVRNASKTYRFAWDVPQKVKKSLRDIQILVSPTRDTTLRRKGLSRLSERLILLRKLKPRLWRGPDQPRRSPGANARVEGRQISPNSIYPNSRSTAIGRLLLVFKDFSYFLRGMRWIFFQLCFS